MADHENSATEPTPGASPWKRRLLVGVVLLLAAVWALPVAVAKTPLLGWLVSFTNAHLDGSVKVGSASLGWFSPLVLHDVSLTDHDNQPVVQIAKVETERTLLGFVLDHATLGTIRVDKPSVDIVCTGSTSNVEKVFGRYLAKPPVADDAPPDAKPAPLPQVHLEVTEGSVKVTDRDAKKSWQVQSLQLSFDVFNDRAAQAHLSATVEDDKEAGSIKLDLSLQGLGSAELLGEAKAKIVTLPLSLANVALRRLSPGTEITGALNGDCTLTATQPSGKLKVVVAGELAGSQCALVSPALDDRLTLDLWKLPCKLTYDDQRLQIDQCDLSCDLGAVKVQGKLDLGKDVLASLEQAGFDLSLKLDLVRLAEKLPRTLKLHQDLKITSGRIDLACKSVVSNNGVVWQGKLEAADLKGVKGTQVIAWSDPIKLDFQARNLGQAMPTLDRIHCDSRFLQINGSTTPEKFEVAADADLQQLASSLGQFVDLAGVRLAGKASANLTLRKLADLRFVVDGGATLKQIQWAWLTPRAWQEESARVQFAAQGRLGDSGPTSLDAARFDAVLGTDFVKLQMQEPIRDITHGPWGQWTVSVEGDLSRWQKRADAWTTALDGWQLGGVARLQTTARCTTSGVECPAITLTGNNLAIVGAGVSIHEPTLDCRVSARFDQAKGSLELTKLDARTQTILADANLLRVQLSPFSAIGSFSVNGDVARMKQWLQDPKAKLGEPLTGKLVGVVDLQASEQRFDLGFNLAVQQFFYGPAANPTWREPSIKLTGFGYYDFKGEAFQLGNVKVESQLLTATAKGGVKQLAATKDVDLTGTLTYDLEKLEPTLRNYLGAGAKVSGKDTKSFHVVGSLFPRGKDGALAMHFTELKGEAAMHWTKLVAFGCDVGPAEVKTVMQRGWLQLYPIHTTLNGGKLSLQPNLRIEPDPMELILLAGPIIDRAKITPAMCSSALGFAMPALANVADAEGAISVQLEGGRIPLSAPTTGEVKGKFILHTAKIGPGSVVRELSALMRVPPPTSLVKECHVPFHMVNGRVHHRDLELVFPQFTLKTSGSVGMDGSLALVVEMPITPELAGTTKLSPALAKQTIKLPINGTVDRPRIDPAAIAQLSAQFARDAAGDVIRQQIDGKLKKLLDRK